MFMAGWVVFRCHSPQQVGLIGGRNWTRTNDPHQVKVVL
jgi:hypothetical protein